MWMVRTGKKGNVSSWMKNIWFERMGYAAGKLSQTVGITPKKHSRKTEIIGFQK